jgi:Cro/C1-type HTH DNA-binding domain
MIISGVPIRWKLREYLESINVTPYALAKAVDMPMPSMYRMLANPTPERIDSKRLGQFLDVLHGMGYKTELSDILEHIPSEES